MPNYLSGASINTRNDDMDSGAAVHVFVKNRLNTSLSPEQNSDFVSNRLGLKGNEFSEYGAKYPSSAVADSYLPLDPPHGHEPAELAINGGRMDGFALSYAPEAERPGSDIYGGSGLRVRPVSGLPGLGGDVSRNRDLKRDCRSATVVARIG